MTTKLQRDADRLDLMIFRACQEAERLAEQHPSFAREFREAARELSAARYPIRRHMHPADRKATENS